MEFKNTFAMTLEDFTKMCHKDGIKFDVITFFEVLEHQDKPKEFLRLIKSMLKEGGYIVGSVPYRDSWLIKVGRRISPSSDRPPHHFLRFSEKALKALCNSVGFKNVFVNPIPAKLSDVVAHIQMSITGGYKINRILRKVINRSDLAAKVTTIYKSLPLWRKSLFETLRFLRFIALFPIALPIRYSVKGNHYLYFQAINC